MVQNIEKLRAELYFPGLTQPLHRRVLYERIIQVQKTGTDQAVSAHIPFVSGGLKYKGTRVEVKAWSSQGLTGRYHRECRARSYRAT